MSDDTETPKVPEGWVDVVLVEVKMSGPCKLNGPWTNHNAENVQLVLAAVGRFHPSRINEVVGKVT